MIINELVTNALKHGFGDDSAEPTLRERHGKVSIELVNSGDDLLILSVGNNGPELAPDFDLSNVQTMGLKLVTALIGQIKGTLDVATGTVTVFKITFPNFVFPEINR